LWTVTCPMSGSGLSPIHCWPSFLAICLLIVHGEISSLPLPSSLVHCQSSCLLYCVLVFSSLFIVHFFFFLQGGAQSAKGTMLVYPRGGWGIPCDTWHSPVWSAKCLSSRFWSWWLSVVAAHLFSQHSIAWRSFLQARDSGLWKF
jgi:hypothetical protein